MEPTLLGDLSVYTYLIDVNPELYVIELVARTMVRLDQVDFPMANYCFPGAVSFGSKPTQSVLKLSQLA